MFGLKSLFGPKNNFKSLVQRGAVIVDVRGATEIAGGHIACAKNISLELIPLNIKELKKLNTAIITCCRSGARSAIASRILKKAGIDAYNGGAWELLQKQLS